MYTYYQLHSASRIYREERLTEARKRPLAAQASRDRRSLFSRLGNAGSVLSGFLSALKW